MFWVSSGMGRLRRVLCVVVGSMVFTQGTKGHQQATCMPNIQGEMVDVKQDFYQVLENVKHCLYSAKKEIEAGKEDFEVVDNQLDWGDIVETNFPCIVILC